MTNATRPTRFTIIIVLLADKNIELHFLFCQLDFWTAVANFSATIPG